MFAKEDLTSTLVRELVPLLAMHRDEISLMPDDVALEPNWDLYEKVAEEGWLHIYTVRIDHLVGYVVFITSAHPHYISQLIAEPDVIYLMPNARKGFIGRNLLRFAEHDLRSLGVSEMRQTVKPSVRDFSPMLLREGYRMTDVIYTKRLV